MAGTDGGCLMALSQLVSGKIATLGRTRKTILTDGTDEVEFSAVMSFTPTLENEITEYTVEDGGTVSEHVRLQPLKISLSAQITVDDPLEADGIFTGSATAEEKLDILEKWVRNGTRLTVITPDKSYESLVMESLPPNRPGPEDAYSLSFGLKEVRVAKSSEREIALPQAARPTNRKGRTEPKTEEVPGQPAQNKSILKSLF